MELFAGDRGVPSPEIGFPGHTVPFPEAAELIYTQTTAAIHSPPELIGHCQGLPPQKLRPIRCSSARSEEAPAGVLGSRSLAEEMGFLEEMPGECLETSAQVEAGEAVKGGGFECRSGEDDPDRVRSGPRADEWGPDCEDEAEESSSSSDDDNSNGEPLNQRRKRKSRRRLELLLENLVTKVMERQEQMHNQLVEIMEKRERERIIREEAWRQQEMQRMKREEEMRAQETSRSLALISFIQNLLGQESQIPEPVTTQRKEEDGGEIGMQNDSRCNPSNRRWNEAEVQALITLRSSLEQKSLAGSKRSIWEEISVEMCNLGFNRTALRCKDKWDNINKYLRRSMENGKKHPANDGGS